MSTRISASTCFDSSSKESNIKLLLHSNQTRFRQSLSATPITNQPFSGADYQRVWGPGRITYAHHGQPSVPSLVFFSWQIRPAP